MFTKHRELKKKPKMSSRETTYNQGCLIRFLVLKGGLLPKEAGVERV